MKRTMSLFLALMMLLAFAAPAAQAADTQTPASNIANVTLDGARIDTEHLACVVNGRTMIPAHYVSELFGQTIEWIPEGRIAAVTENKSLAGEINLEAWALAIGSYLNYSNTGDADWFGACSVASPCARILSDCSSYRGQAGNRC